MINISPEEHRVWAYLLDNPLATAKDLHLECEVSIELAQSCIDRIGTPREVFEKEAKSTRVQTLETAIRLTGGDRNKTYGPPYDNLSDCANMWNAYINSKQGCIVRTEQGYEVRLTAEDVSWFMVLVKMTRSFNPGYHPDNYTDATAYSAIAGECREIENQESENSV